MYICMQMWSHARILFSIEKLYATSRVGQEKVKGALKRRCPRGYVTGFRLSSAPRHTLSTSSILLFVSHSDMIM